MIPNGAALLLVDVQQGFDDPGWGARNNPDAERNIARLLEAWRAAAWPVLHVQHVSAEPGSVLGPGRPGVEPKPEAMPAATEPLFQKNVNSAFIGTNLESQLRERGIEALVIVGLTTDHCVSTTARMAGNLGFETFVVGDATASFDRVAHDGRRFGAADVHAISLASLHGEFATVLGTDEALAATTARRG